MIIKIARKEMTELWRDGRFRWSGLIVFALLLVALAVGWKNYTTVKREHDTANAESRRTWEDQGKRNPHSAAHFGVYAFKPKTPLSLIDSGLDNYTGTNIWVEAHYQNPSRGRPVEDATALQRFGELTAAGVLLLLLPLLIVFLGFDIFAGERERGTLRQALSIGVKQSDFALGKLLGLLAALGILLVPATIAGVLALALATGNDLLLASLPRFTLLCLSYLLYFSAFAGIVVAVSALVATARLSLVILIGFWILSSLVVPRLANDLAERVYPEPSSEQFWAAIDKDLKEGVDGHNPANDRTKALEEKLIQQYGVAKREDLPINFNGIALNAGEEYASQVFDKHWSRVWHTYYSQQKVHQAFGVVAPFLPTRSLSMGFAGTDLAHYEDFTGAVEQYRRDFNRMLNMDFAENSKTKDGYNYFVDRELWERSPDFAYQQPNVTWALTNQIWNLLILAAWAFGAIAIGIYAAVRMRID